MKILLVAPATKEYRFNPKQGHNLMKMFRFSLLSVLSVAACTPPKHEIKIIDEHVDYLDFDINVDVVGVSFMTAHANRAYEIGDEFLKRNRVVVFGGYHPTFMADEALNHCNAVVKGEAENLWPQLLRDMEKNKLKRVYSAGETTDLAQLQIPPRHLLKKKNYVNINAVQATRGCDNECEFCSVSSFFKQKQRFRPIDKVMEEIETLDSKFFLFIDDNITGDIEYAKRLFESLIPFKKKWVSQTSITITDDPELLKLAAQSGCCGLFIGIESVNSKSLAEVNKGFNKVEQYKTAIKKLHHHGICIEAGLMFGFDSDDLSVFEMTMDFTDRVNLDGAQVSVVTPLPGTAFFTRLQKAGRIFDYNWQHYDYRNVIFTPMLMTAEQLQQGFDWFSQEFYRKKRIVKRIANNLIKGNVYSTLVLSLPVNIAYYNFAKKFGVKTQLPTAC